MNSAEAQADEDAALVARVGQGDAAAFRMLVERHNGPMYRLAWRMLMNAAEAEDVVQEALTRLWTGAPNWRPGSGRVGGWLRRVCTNLCLDRLRRRPALDLADVPEPADDRTAAPEKIDGDRLGALVTDALGVLHDRQRTAIVLTYYELLPNARAAEQMGMNVKAFESLLLRARAALRKRLEARGVSAGDLTGEAA